MKLDIIIVAYHGKAALADTLASIALHSRVGYRLTVVENGEKNYPLGWIWNQFIAQSRRDLIAVLNPDIIVGPGWDTEAEACLLQHPECGVASPLTNHPPQQEILPPLIPHSLSLGDVAATTDLIRTRFAERRFVFTKDQRMTPHHCVLFRRDSWSRIQGYNERVPFGGNDYNFNERIVRAGMQLAICTHAFSFHRGRVSTGDAIKLGTFNVEANCPRFQPPPSGASFVSI